MNTTELKTKFPIPILYEDEDVFVLDKPAGLAVQGGKNITRSLDALLEAHFSPRPLLVHRLDQNTSGAILVAKHKEAAAFFTKIIAGRRIQKTYLAVCKKSPMLKPQSVIGETITVKGEVKNAVTHYRTIADAGDFALVELTLETGRMHQIRRHLSALNAPVIGDDKYGDFTLNKALKKERHIKHLLLHSARITFPAETGRVTVEVPLPPYFSTFAELITETHR
ncbi:MAG: RluA family pseudouridine synthase [Spirochaetaceae bacterium]|nr:RluA family pseudouridine synthase [Spirochaetaceae bacterium]